MVKFAEDSNIRRSSEDEENKPRHRRSSKKLIDGIARRNIRREDVIPYAPTVSAGPVWINTDEITDRRFTDRRLENIWRMSKHKNQIIRRGPLPHCYGLLLKEEDLPGRIWDVSSNVLIEAFFEEKPFVQQQIDSFDRFLKKYMPDIIVSSLPIVIEQQVRYLEENPSRVKSCSYRFTAVKLRPPAFRETDGISKCLAPFEARLRNLTYSTEVYGDVEETVVNYGGNTEVLKEAEIFIGSIPLMVRSERCLLTQKTAAADLALDRECKMDPGGYFIVKGSEKVVILQERAASNQVNVYAGISGPYAFKAEVRSALAHGGSSATIPLWINLRHPDKKLIATKREGAKIVAVIFGLKDPVPLTVLFRALGCLRDREIMAHVTFSLDDYDTLQELQATIDEGLPIRSQEDALKFLGNRLMQPGPSVTAAMRMEKARMLLRNQVLPHLGTKETDFRPKVFFLGYVVRRLLFTANGQEPVSDRDHHANKRLESVGVLLKDLFRHLFYTSRKYLKDVLEKKLNKGLQPNIKAAMKSKLISDGLEYALATGNWRCGRNFSRVGVSQVLNRLNYCATLSHVRRLHMQIDRQAKVSRPRQLHNTHWGVICPAETPEGQSVGIIKNLALMAFVTLDSDEKHVRERLELEGMQTLRDIQPEGIGSLTKVFLNGAWIGVHDAGRELAESMRQTRRNYHNVISSETSIVWTPWRNELSILTDAGRVCRPLLIVDHDQRLLLKKGHIERLADPLLTYRKWSELIQYGIVEYIDVSEEENILCAMFPDDLDRTLNSRYRYTHCEIHPSMILGVSASHIPFPDHNQSPRNTYQAGMAKQAMGVYLTSYVARFDTESHILFYPQKPLAFTNAELLSGNDELPTGVNCVVTIASYTGYNQEDSIIFNSASIQRGLFRHTLYRTYSTTEDVHRIGDQVQRIQLPDRNIVQGMQYDGYGKLDADGIVEPGCRVSEKDCLIGKATEYRRNTRYDVGGDESGTTWKDSSLYLKSHSTGIVDQCMISLNAEGHKFVKVRVRSVRSPVMGDKFSSRHGQKGTIGICYPPEDMPFTARGTVPDLIINPHAIPSRMTIGHLLETLSGKTFSLANDTASARADIANATPFRKLLNVRKMGSELERLGYHRDGVEVMYNGYNGNKLNTQFFIGTTYYQRLKHLVEEKVYARARGAVTLLTRQPQEGRARGGGLRFGEMERDCLISHGASLNLWERLCYASDAYRFHICSKCGFITAIHKHQPVFDCRSCRGLTELHPVTIPYAFKLLVQELMSMSIAPRMYTD